MLSPAIVELPIKKKNLNPIAFGEYVCLFVYFCIGFHFGFAYYLCQHTVSHRAFLPRSKYMRMTHDGAGPGYFTMRQQS